MDGKMASLKSPVASSKELDRIQEHPDYSLHWPEGFKGEKIKKRSQEGTLQNKYNQQYHKLFKDIPLEEVVLKVCSCALQRDLLLQGRLYISPNWLCFHASLFGKDIKVVIPVVSVQTIKKHKMARLLPNGLAITTNTSQKYVFVSLLSRDSVYDMLRRVCTHLQPSSKKSLSVREFPEEPECKSLVRAEARSKGCWPEITWGLVASGHPGRGSQYRTGASRSRACGHAVPGSPLDPPHFYHSELLVLGRFAAFLIRTGVQHQEHCPGWIPHLYRHRTSSSPWLSQEGLQEDRDVLGEKLQGYHCRTQTD
ncbi:GRAM domain-containing protein 2A isoform X2 [Loxodonta africana]|uniref:GRAM domain-containing protein 2A isoform X2 n=1 Tax=Loxodonta africana TaxID=9785 RepID=UPI0030D3F059